MFVILLPVNCVCVPFAVPRVREWSLWHECRNTFSTHLLQNALAPQVNSPLPHLGFHLWFTSLLTRYAAIHRAYLDTTCVVGDPPTSDSFFLPVPLTYACLKQSQFPALHVVHTSARIRMRYNVGRVHWTNIRADPITISIVATQAEPSLWGNFRM